MTDTPAAGAADPTFIFTEYRTRGPRKYFQPQEGVEWKVKFSVASEPPSPGLQLRRGPSDPARTWEPGPLLPPHPFPPFVFQQNWERGLRFALPLDVFLPKQDLTKVAGEEPYSGAAAC